AVVGIAVVARFAGEHHAVAVHGVARVPGTGVSAADAAIAGAAIAARRLVGAVPGAAVERTRVVVVALLGALADPVAAVGSGAGLPGREALPPVGLAGRSAVEPARGAAVVRRSIPVIALLAARQEPVPAPRRNAGDAGQRAAPTRFDLASR